MMRPGLPLLWRGNKGEVTRQKKENQKEKIMSNIKLFEDKKIRSEWDADAETWYFAIVILLRY